MIATRKALWYLQQLKACCQRPSLSLVTTMHVFCKTCSEVTSYIDSTAMQFALHIFMTSSWSHEQAFAIQTMESVIELLRRRSITVVIHAVRKSACYLPDDFQHVCCVCLSFNARKGSDGFVATSLLMIIWLVRVWFDNHTNSDRSQYWYISVLYWHTSNRGRCRLDMTYCVEMVPSPDWDVLL